MGWVGSPTMEQMEGRVPVKDSSGTSKNQRVGCLTWWSCSKCHWNKGWTKCGVAPGMASQQLFPHSKLLPHPARRHQHP